MLELTRDLPLGEGEGEAVEAREVEDRAGEGDGEDVDAEIVDEAEGERDGFGI